jgi:hypothetical protein
MESQVFYILLFAVLARYAAVQRCREFGIWGAPLLGCGRVVLVGLAGVGWELCFFVFAARFHFLVFTCSFFTLKMRLKKKI